MYGFVVVDDRERVKSFLDKTLGDKLRFVEIDKYKVGGQYPKSDIDDYTIAEVKFIEGINNKLYVFRNYDNADIGDVVAVDTVYGIQAAKVVAVHDKDDWDGIEPTKDIICIMPWDNFMERKNERNERRHKELAKRRLLDDIKNTIEDAKALTSDEIAEVFMKVRNKDEEG